MKVHTKELLCEALDSELAWRLHELNVIRVNVERTKKLEKEVAIKAAIALLYAHWEGAIKQFASLYLEHISLQGISSDKLKTNFLTGIWKKELKEIAVQNSYFSITQKLETLLHAKSSSGCISCVVDTKSNLKSDVFKDIATQVGISDEEFSVHYVLIDKVLVHNRNTIAHGQRIESIDEKRYLDIHEKIISLIERFKILISNAAVTKSYIDTSDKT